MVDVDANGQIAVEDDVWWIVYDYRWAKDDEPFVWRTSYQHLYS